MLYSLSVEAATLLALALAAAAPTVALAAPAVALAAVTLAVAVAALALAVLALALALALAATTLTAAGAPCRRRPCRQLSAKKSVKVLLMYTHRHPKGGGGADPPVVILILTHSDLSGVGRGRIYVVCVVFIQFCTSSGAVFAMKMGFWRTKTPIFPADPRERDELWHPLVNTPSIWAGKSS